MEENVKDKNLQVTVVNEGAASNSWVEIYKSTLTFISGMAVPVAIVVLGLTYKDAIVKAIDDGKVKKIDTPFLSAEFVESIVDEVTDPTATAEVKETAARKIEVAEEIARIQTESGKIPEASVEALAAPPVADKQDDNWRSILGISWVKPNDFLGMTYYLTIKKGIYVWPTFIDEENNRVRFIVNDSPTSRKDGKKYLDDVWIRIGKSADFKVSNEVYRLNLVNIKKAGKFPSNAAYVSVDSKPAS